MLPGPHGPHQSLQVCEYLSRRPRHLFLLNSHKLEFTAQQFLLQAILFLFMGAPNSLTLPPAPASESLSCCEYNSANPLKPVPVGPRSVTEVSTAPADLENTHQLQAPPQRRTHMAASRYAFSIQKVIPPIYSKPFT